MQSLNHTVKLFRCYMTQGLWCWFKQVHVQRCVRLNVCNYACVYGHILAPGGCFYRWQSGSTQGWDSCLRVWTSSCFQHWGEHITTRYTWSLTCESPAYEWITTMQWADSRGERMNAMHIVWTATMLWACVHGRQGTMSGCAAKKSILMPIKPFSLLK